LPWTVERGRTPRRLQCCLGRRRYRPATPKRRDTPYRIAPQRRILRRAVILICRVRHRPAIRAPRRQ
jgi:hypothetical protein